jgi:flagellar hook-associated protein 2
MATINFPGLLTGIDTNAIIEQLMAVESRTLITWQNRKALWEEKSDALSTLQTKLQNLRSSVQALSDADELRAFNVSTSDDGIITAEATNNAFEGNHTIVVSQLANAEQWVHTTGHEYAEDYVGAGTFIYSYNNKETSITTTATTTLQELVGLINNDANNPGVTASLMHYDDAYHLVLNGNDAGTDYQIHINTGSTEVWKSDSAFTYDNDNATLSTKIKDLDQFSGTLSDSDGYKEHIEITGKDHFGVSIAQVDIYVTENTTLGHLISEINDAFDGRAEAVLEDGKIVLTDSTGGTSSLSISLKWDANGGGTLLSGLAMSFTTEGNATEASLDGYEASAFTKSQAAQDSKIKVDGFPNTSATPEVQTVSLSGSPDDGSFTLTYRGETTSDIDYDATADEIEEALEALSTVNSGDITVSSSIGNGTTFEFASSLGNVDMLMIKSSLTNGGNPVTASISETAQGSDGYVSRSSNTVDDVVSGVTLHLHDTTDANGEEITLTRDIQLVKDKLNQMVTAYNFVVEHIKETTGYDETTQVGGVLMGDYIVSTIQYQFREPLIEQAAGFLEDIDSFLTPANIGLEIDKDGVLSLDTNVFDEAIAEDYMGVLDLIGANKTGSSTSDTIEFYSASTNYTTAGEYNVQVTVSGGVIQEGSAKIKLSTESTYRDMTISGNIITGDSSFDDNGDPVYAENGLQLSVDLTTDDDYTATIYVKQGFAGKIEGRIDAMLKATVGSVVIDQDFVEDQIGMLDDKIELEEYRLGLTEERLILRFANLEKTLALLQNQMAAAGILSTS